MEIRFLTANDAREWWRLRLEALEGDPAAFSASAEDHRNLTLDDMIKRLGPDEEDSFVAGAFEGQRLTGMVGFYREKGLKSRHKGRIWGVYVTPAKRGIHIGLQMLEMVRDRAKQIEGLQQILLSVTFNQIAAIRLYQSLGFKPFGCEPRALRIGENYINEQYMILQMRS